MLSPYKRKISNLMGDHEDEYDILLAEGGNAMIDGNGIIYLGEHFLAAHANNLSVLIGALAHEIGHRPKRWKNERYQMKRQLTLPEKQAICRFEETRADIFAGKALAELDLDPEALIEFLERAETHPHPEYFPAKVRGEVIREAYSERRYRTEQRRKLFRRYDRMTSAKNYIGEG